MAGITVIAESALTTIVTAISEPKLRTPLNEAKSKMTNPNATVSAL
jgi:hypothetical protein